MSLLLDALKKAADDKAKNSRDQSLEESASNVQAAQPEPVTEPSSNRSAERLQQAPDSLSADNIEVTEELTLDIESEDELVLPEDEIESGVPEYKPGTEDVNSLADEIRGDDNSNRNRQDASKFTISDDALSLLIDKTNRDVKQGKKNLIIGVAITSLVILLSGGFYYYTDMQTEIASIERKHQIAMKSMRLKTSREQTPDQSAIIRNLVSDARLEEKVKYAKAQIANEQKPAASRPQAQPSVNKKVQSAEFSIKRTNKSDPVGEKLDAAWLAYESGDFSEAKKLYKESLNIEGDNRDAQLGLGAIAVIEKDTVKARTIYQSLLQQDPRDPIATAALAAMSNDKSTLQSDNDYLLSLLSKNPEAPHLNFSVGNNYAQQNKWKSAQQYYFKAWQLDSENADYLFNLAVSMDQLGKLQQAIGFYNDSLTKSSNRQVSFSRDAVRKRINELTEL